MSSRPSRRLVRSIAPRDVVAEQVKECITVNANFKNPTPKPPPARPTDFRRLSFEHVLCRSLPADSRAINLAGRPSYPLRGVRLADVSVLGEVRKALAIAYATDVSIAARVGAGGLRPSERRGTPDVERHDVDDVAQFAHLHFVQEQDGRSAYDATKQFVEQDYWGVNRSPSARTYSKSGTRARPSLRASTRASCVISIVR